MTTPGSKPAPDPTSPTWAERPTRADVQPRPEFEARALQAVSARYEIVSELGRGGMGVVLKARDRETEEIVALKLLQPDIAANPEWEKRFKDELRLARKITHKNVCRVYELLRFGDTAAIAMEFVEGETLRRVMRRFGGLPLRKTIEVVKDICSGLREAHAQGVVHRDLKPENVMIDGAGSVRIMDFGLARSAAGDLSSGQSRGITGTPEYMSPEQANGKPADTRSDIYALGLILFELLTGRAPFTGDSAVVIALKHVNETPPSPRDLEPTIPHNIERVILRCLEKNPAKRFQTVEELEEALTSKQRVQEAVATEEEPEDVPLPIHLMRWQKSDYRLLAGGVVAAIIFFASFSFYTPYHYVRFTSPGATVDSIKGIGTRLGTTVDVRDCNPMITITSYNRLSWHTDPKWIDRKLSSYLTATECTVTPAGGSALPWSVRPDGSVERIRLSVRPAILPPRTSVPELREALNQIGRDLSGMKDESFDVRSSTDGRHVRLVAENRPHLPDGNVNVEDDRSDWGRAGKAEFSMFSSYWNRQSWDSVEWRYWYAAQQQLLIAVLLVAVVLFFARKLHRRPPSRPAIAIALGTTALLAVAIGPQVRRAIENALPRSVVYTWNGLTEPMFSDWEAITDKIFIAAADVVFLLVIAAAVLVLRYYGRRGDPIRTWVLFRYKEGWRTSLALGALRGLFLGAVLAASFVALLACTHWTLAIFADVSWIAWLRPSSDFREYLSYPLSFAGRIFALSLLEACAAAFLLTLPACVAARAGARPQIVVASAALFWILVQFSMVGMTTSDLVFSFPGIVLQAVFLAIVYWRYDVVTAMATVFFGEMFAMGYATYQTFRTFDSTFYIPALGLWLLVAATAFVTYFRSEVSGGLRRAARVFE